MVSPAPGWVRLFCTSYPWSVAARHDGATLQCPGWIENGVGWSPFPGGSRGLVKGPISDYEPARQGRSLARRHKTLLSRMVMRDGATGLVVHPLQCPDPKSYWSGVLQSFQTFLNRLAPTEQSAPQAQVNRGQAMVKKPPSPVDKHVGSRVRMRRKMLGMSQEKLAGGLGLTFQQVQKYESGTNRIGASRLQHISHILQIPVAFFFEGAPHVPGQPEKIGELPSPAYVSEFLATTDGLALIKAFMRVKAPMLRRRIVELVKEIAGDDLR